MTRRRWFGAGAAVVAAVGVVLVVLAFVMPTTTPPPPQPAAAGVAAGVAEQMPSSTPAAPAAPTTSAATSAAPAPTVLPKSVPTAVDVPAIGVHSTLLQLGLNPDRTVQVPPLERDSKAGWYTYSPSPGELGPAVLLGHVDSAQYGPGVFYRLGQLQPGETVDVTRSDHTIVTFVIDRVESYPKDSFPSIEVYGNTADAQLRLITCGGIFDHATRNYENNIVVYAHLRSTRAA